MPDQTGTVPKTVDITPTPRVLRMLGQIDFAPWQCLAELIDNSIDAFIELNKAGGIVASPRISVSLLNDQELRAGEGKLVVQDNAAGMSLEDMENAVRAGYSGNDPVEKMGLFGMGFNISTARLGRRTEVWTTTSDSSEWIGILIDFGDLERDGTFHVPVQFKAKSETELETRAHGTRVEISVLEADRMRPLIWGSGKGYTKQRLGKIYGRVMSQHDITISYDGDLIKPWRHCVWDSSRTVPTKEFGNVPARIEINETLASRKFCTTCWVWLEPEDLECVACGETTNVIERQKTITGWIGIQRYFSKDHFGIDLIRNGRVIESLDKSLFTYRDPNGEELFEYPRDTPQWGGRIVGELEIDFVRVSHQKDSFDKLDPEWKEVVERVRGDSPIQPMIASRMGHARNTSALARLFAGYRKTKAELKNLVPGDERGNGLNSGIILEYVDKFYADDPEYQSDKKWYDLVLQAERASRGESAGADDAAGEMPIDDDTPDDDEESQDGTPTATEDAIEEAAPEKNNVLSRKYEIAFLPGPPSILVEAYKHDNEISGKPFVIRPDGYKFRYDYCATSTFFEENLESPTDCLITELAHHFLALSGESSRNHPVSVVSREIRRQYFPDTLADISLAAEEAMSLFNDLRRRYDDLLPEHAPIDSELLTSSEVERIGRRAVREDGATESEIDAIICNGQFAKYADEPLLERLVKLWPEVVMDELFFSAPFRTLSENLRSESLNPVINALQDIRWLMQEGSGAVSKDTHWRLQFARALASLRLLQSWQA